MKNLVVVVIRDGNVEAVHSNIPDLDVQFRNYDDMVDDDQLTHQDATGERHQMFDRTIEPLDELLVSKQVIF